MFNTYRRRNFLIITKWQSPVFVLYVYIVDVSVENV